ncbi:MAG: tryptophan synthase subunit alpha [bacterium]
MSQIMTHLVANYPTPELYQQALEAILKKNVAYLEVQFPFSHPVGDGTVIYEANQVALKNNQDLKSTIEMAAQTKYKMGSKTELILMGYLTPFLDFGLENFANLLRKNAFKGAIVPDLAFGSGEQVELSNLFKQDLDLIPVISPLTSTIRLGKIKNWLQPDQIVYATARSGQTGSQSNLEDQQTKTYFEFLKSELAAYKIAIGFGIKTKEQVQFLNRQDFIAVIGSQIVREINQAVQSKQSTSKQLQDYLETLD